MKHDLEFIHFNEYDIWVVVEKYNGSKQDDDYRYAGAPCTSYGEAIDLMNGHVYFNNTLELSKLVEDGAYYDEISSETGEIIKEYIIKKVGRF